LIKQSLIQKHKEAQQITSVTVAQLPFLENSFQKNKILTSLETILERFVFKILKFRALKMDLLKLYNMVFIKVLVYLSSATCTMNLQNPKNGSKLPSRDFANPMNRKQKFYQKL
jgi:hypothetical protein